MATYFGYPAQGPGTAFIYSTLGTIATTPTLDSREAVGNGVVVSASLGIIGTATSIPAFAITSGTAGTTVLSGSATTTTAASLFTFTGVDTSGNFPTFYQLKITPVSGNAVTVTNAVLFAQATGE